MPRSNKEVLYDIAITELFERLRSKSSQTSYLDYKKSDLEAVVSDLVGEGKLTKIIKNIPDIKYTYDARRDFPQAIAKHGNWAITGRGKSKYRFERLSHNNLIRIPQDLQILEEVVELRDETPDIVNRVLGDDEQATIEVVPENRTAG